MGGIGGEQISAGARVIAGGIMEKIDTRHSGGKTLQLRVHLAHIRTRESKVGKQENHNFVAGLFAPSPVLPLTRSGKETGGSSSSPGSLRYFDRITCACSRIWRGKHYWSIAYQLRNGLFDDIAATIIVTRFLTTLYKLVI